MIFPGLVVLQTLALMVPPCIDYAYMLESFYIITKSFAIYASQLKLHSVHVQSSQSSDNFLRWLFTERQLRDSILIIAKIES